jgi:CRP-like cAMP-binding protein
MPEIDVIRLAALRCCALFANGEQSLLQKAVQRSIAKSLSRGEVLFREGDPSVHISLVIRGRIRLRQIGGQGEEIVVRYVGPGELTALVSLFRGKPYPVTANAVEPTAILQWTRDALEGLFKENPRLAMNAMSMMVERIGELQDRYRELATERVAQRVARALLRLAGQAGRPTADGVLIDMPLSRQDLASMTGTTLYSVSRLISEWTHEGILDSGRERVVIVQQDVLTALAEDNHDLLVPPATD